MDDIAKYLGISQIPNSYNQCLLIINVYDMYKT
jgi:hypothetical protein